VSKNCRYSDQIGLQFDHQIRFWSGLFGGGAAESHDRGFGGSDVALPLFGSGRLDQTGSSSKAGLIAVFYERGVWIKESGHC
jgi:hypothetical protein